MTTLTSQLVVSLLDRVSAPARAVSAQISGLQRSIAANNQALAAARGNLFGAGAAAFALGHAISAPVRAASELQSAMADIAKVVDFPQPDGLAQMQRDILDMTREIPMAATDLARIVADAGQAGMAGDELLSFAELAAKVGVAFDMSAGQTGESLAKIKTALGLSIDDTRLLADAMNHLSNTSASAAPDLLDFMRRVGSTGKQYGFTAVQTAAIGSAMVAAGAQSDVAATSFRNVGMALARGASASPAQRRVFKQLGLSATDVAKRLQKDAVGTLTDVIARIRKLPKEMQASAITDLFGAEARAIMPLIENADLLANALGQVSDESKYATSAGKEYLNKLKTFDAAWTIFMNGLRELEAQIGNALLPGIRSLMGSILPVIHALAELAGTYPNVTAGIVSVTSAVIGLNVALIAARFAWLFLKSGMLSGALGIARAIGALGRGAAFLGHLAAMIGRVGLAMTLLSATGGTGAMATLVTTLTGAAGAIGAALGTVTLPVVALAAAVAALGILVYTYWEPISNFLSGFAEGVTDALAAAVTAAADFGARMAAEVGSWAGQKLIDFGVWLGVDEATMQFALDFAVSSLSQSLAQMAKMITDMPSRVGNWIADLFAMKDYSDAAEAEFRSAGKRIGKALADEVLSGFSGVREWLAAFPRWIADAIGPVDVSGLVSQFAEAGTKAGKALIDGIIKAFDELWAWLAGLPRRVVDAIGSIDLSGVIKLPSLWGGGGDGAAATEAAESAISGARAAGGPIVGGRTYLVGEYGPELVTPSRSGHVHDADATRSMLGGPRPVSVSFGSIVIQGVQDPEAIARHIGQRLREELAGLQADTAYSIG
jgi:TP901 family phage tail tape measure protein